MPDLEPKQLYNRNPVGGAAVSGAGGKFAVLFSLPFLLIGLGVMIAAPYALKNEPDGPPPFVGVAFGASFFLAGALVFGSGIRSILNQRRAIELSQRGREMWEIDFPWDPQGRHDSGTRGVLTSLTITAFMTVFLTPFNWFVISDDDMPLFAKGIIGFFDLILLWLAGYCVYVLLRRLKYGVSTLHYERFPYFLGETLNAKFSARTIGRFRSFTMTLRCIEERPETCGDSQTLAFWQIYSDSVEIKEAGVHENLGDALPVTFNLPLGNYGTKISGCVQPRYWELEIHADTPGVDYCAQFLVPVYAREQTSTTADTASPDERIESTG